MRRGPQAAGTNAVSGAINFSREKPMVDYLRILLAARFAKTEERGASAVEYGLLIAGIAALIVVVVFAFGDNLTGIFKDTCSSITASGAGSGDCG